MFEQFILPALLIGGMSAILAFLLAYLGKKLAVKHDERIDKIQDNLAGANCGGCGYPGCATFAQALVKGETDLSKCAVTSEVRKSEIASILGIELGNEERKVGIVRCMGGDNCNAKYNYQGYYSCESEDLIVGGNKSCPTGCLGLGTCVSACSFGAITIKDGVAHVDYKKCRACGACVTKCPKKLIDKIPLTAKVYIACSSHCKGKEVMGACSKGCIGCGKCARVCPNVAIEIKDNLPIIDYSKCNGCKTCVTSCVRKCIKEYLD